MFFSKERINLRYGSKNDKQQSLESNSVYLVNTSLISWWLVSGLMENSHTAKIHFLLCK